MVIKNNHKPLIFLTPIRERPSDYDEIERKIKAFFKREIYYPLLREFKLKRKTLLNAADDLAFALQSGRLYFSRGSFYGELNATLSKELRELGCVFDQKTKRYKINLKDLPPSIRSAIQASDFKFKEKIKSIDARLAKIWPDELVEQLNLTKNFEDAIGKVERDFQKTAKNLTIKARLTPDQKRRIAAEWSQNIQLYIRDFTQKEILDLRKNMQKSVFAGNRYGSAVKAIQESYGVSERKAKFLARQETNLLMTKFKQTRYEAAGVEWYQWKCVSGTALHPVRPMHLKNKDKFFRWDNPPTVDEQGNKKNPGQDYNCRCFARPAINYRPKNT